MIINLIRDCNYPETKYLEIFEILKNTSGPLNFKKCDPIKEDMLDAGVNVNIKHLFNSCKRFRRQRQIAKNEFIIYITTLNNNDEWYSRFDKNRHAFIYGREWDRMRKLSVYPVAYEIIANVLQSLMKLSLRTNSKLLHKDPIGCMNDFCDDKLQIILKLRTGDICERCVKELEKKEVPTLVIDQGIEIFEKIRVQLLYRQGLKSKISPIKFTRNSIELKNFGNYSLVHRDFTAIRKAIFLFFLLHPEGIHRFQLSKHRKELLKLYQKFSSSDKMDKIEKTIDRFIEKDSSFETNLSHLNTAILATIGIRMGKEYTINRYEQGYRTQLPPDYVIQEIEEVSY